MVNKYKELVGRPPQTTGIQKNGKNLLLWLEPPDWSSLQEIADKQRMNNSQAIRFLIRSYIKSTGG